MNTKQNESVLLRYFRFVRYLQQPHTIRDIMDHFGIEKRTVYRFLDNLQNAGVEFTKSRSLMLENGTVTYKLKSI